MTSSHALSRAASHATESAISRVMVHPSSVSAVALPGFAPRWFLNASATWIAFATRPPAIATFFSAQALTHPSMVMQAWLRTAATASESPFTNKARHSVSVWAGANSSVTR